ncbi:hypothetical protein [Nocardiopsis sp. MG754419]|uniref:hypothetical protein n=1 Tax=Nocardiopsis sp. MG754419 TaxID=2259865 RepID=UPI001BAB9E21|nr:hypothetical protein [Nocardiopsis sp. MG754419]MBR8742291.1 hypothetical protein [Nocardiopsis sp. MG754419]
MDASGLRPGAWREARSPYAWMSRGDGELLLAVLEFAARGQGHVRVLEWGSGQSTLEFTRLLRERGLTHDWTALEYDRTFFDEQVLPALRDRPGSEVRYPDDDAVLTVPGAGGPSRITGVCWNRTRLRPAEHRADRDVDLDAYVDYPVGREPYDVVFVDGRMRRRCLLTVAELLGPSTIVVLHDAWHEYYHCALKSYPVGRFCGDEMWIGARAEAVLPPV